MNTFGKLFLARIKMFTRDKRSLFWTTFFPIMFILIFGLFDFDQMSTSNVAIFDEANSEISQTLVEKIKEQSLFKISDDYSTIDEAKSAVVEGDLDFVFVLPAGFEVPSGFVDGEYPVSALMVYYDQTNVQVNGVVFSVLNQYISGLNMQIAQTPLVFMMEPQAMDSRNIEYLDILVPGILAMSIMQSGLFGIAIGIVRFRDKGTLRKLISTPLKIRDFLMAFVASYMIINLFQVTLIFLLSIYVFHVQVFGSIALMYLLAILGQIIFLSLGFAVSGVAKTVDSAQGMIQVISMPMMFLSGVFFSAEALPSWVRGIVDFLPLTPFIEALRKVALQDAHLPDLQHELLFMLGWIVVAIILALKLFKFETES